MKTICVKSDNNLVVQNISGNPSIILIFPITRDGQGSISKWESAISFVNRSTIDSFIVIDKTSQGTASQYFMSNFNVETKNLYVLPRSINESHYETLGCIELDSNLWIMQLHDDDTWDGFVALPKLIDKAAAYYSDFFMVNESDKITQHLGFSTPGRINFTLLPSHVWNMFAKFIQNQNYHVAGSLDSTLNQMVQMCCDLLPIPNFSYYYDNHNWDSKKSSKESLSKLVRNDGWGIWASVDMALFSRLLDNLSSLWYVKDFVTVHDIREMYTILINQIKPRLRRRLLIRFEILRLSMSIISPKSVIKKVDGISWLEIIKSKRASMVFIRNSWSARNFKNLIELIGFLENSGEFPILTLGSIHLLN